MPRGPLSAKARVAQTASYSYLLAPNSWRWCRASAPVSYLLAVVQGVRPGGCTWRSAGAS